MILLHCADLHLVSKPDDEMKYSLSVLDEVIEIAKKEKASAILFCGDTFDTFNDAENLRKEFRERISSLSNCEVFMLAGNHEYIGRKEKKLKNYDFGITTDTIVEDVPYRYYPRNDFDLIAIPHSNELQLFSEWNIPEKTKGARIALAHGTISNMIYAGPVEEEEEPANVFDINLFQRYKIDYVAMGHIHSSKTAQYDSLHVVYPGSARVWRKGEFGPRHIAIIHAGPLVSYELRALRTAGEYRSINLFVDFLGNVNLFPETTKEWTKHDRAFLLFSGIVEDETTARENITQIIDSIKKQVRKVEFEDSIEVLSGISHQPLAKKYLEIWNKIKPTELEKQEAWNRAREMGLLKIKEKIEASR
jgi:DNA repair exonuclease SbcCD nuclease subunit